MATGASSIANGLTLDRLPVEILYMVVEELRTEDVTQLRLVCKLFAEVGMGHLFSDIQLIFKPSSFDRLGQVSQHPVISKKVTSIYYETSILMRFDDFETWKSFIVRPRLLSAMSAVGAAERTVDDIQTLQGRRLRWNLSSREHVLTSSTSHDGRFENEYLHFSPPS